KSQPWQQRQSCNREKDEGAATKDEKNGKNEVKSPFDHDGPLDREQVVGKLRREHVSEGEVHQEGERRIVLSTLNDHCNESHIVRRGDREKRRHEIGAERNRAALCFAGELKAQAEGGSDEEHHHAVPAETDDVTGESGGVAHDWLPGMDEKHHQGGDSPKA